MTPDLVFRDPYMLDFLGLPHGYSERDLEDAILREMESFLLELGTGFTFVTRQKRITVGTDDFYLDLLFYHRHLRRLGRHPDSSRDLDVSPWHENAPFGVHPYT